MTLWGRNFYFPSRHRVFSCDRNRRNRILIKLFLRSFIHHIAHPYLGRSLFIRNGRCLRVQLLSALDPFAHKSTNFLILLLNFLLLLLYSDTLRKQWRILREDNLLFRHIYLVFVLLIVLWGNEIRQFGRGKILRDCCRNSSPAFFLCLIIHFSLRNLSLGLNLIWVLFKAREHWVIDIAQVVIAHVIVDLVLSRKLIADHSLILNENSILITLLLVRIDKAKGIHYICIRLGPSNQKIIFLIRLRTNHPKRSVRRSIHAATCRNYTAERCLLVNCRWQFIVNIVLHNLGKILVFELAALHLTTELRNGDLGPFFIVSKDYVLEILS